MKGSLAGRDLVAPRSLRHALELMAEHAGTVPLAGATDLYVALNAGALEGNRFLDLWKLARLRRIGVTDGTLTIGALATYTDLIRSRLIRRHLPILATAAREIGGLQIQNRGTLGGNIANASPAGDTLPVLAVAGATIVLQSVAGERRVSFDRFYTGYRATVRRLDELITAVEIPPVGSGQWFRKVGTRAAQAISKVVMAAVRSPEPRVALGSVAATVVRLPRTEAALAANDIDGAVRELEQEIHPIDDLRSSAEYRKAVAGNLLRRFWTDTSR